MKAFPMPCPPIMPLHGASKWQALTCGQALVLGYMKPIYGFLELRHTPIIPDNMLLGIEALTS